MSETGAKQAEMLEQFFGDYDVPQEPFQKALTVSTPIRQVYAKWLTCASRFYEEIIGANQWVVWWTDMDTPLYEEISAEDFSSRFVLESQAPPSMKHVYDAMPTYEQWCDMHNTDEESPQ